MNIYFEDAIESDAEALANLRVAAMRESVEHIGRFDPVRARERLLSSFNAAATRHVVADRSRMADAGERDHLDDLRPNEELLQTQCRVRGKHPSGAGDETNAVGLRTTWNLAARPCPGSRTDRSRTHRTRWTGPRPVPHRQRQS